MRAAGVMEEIRMLSVEEAREAVFRENRELPGPLTK
jgi:hypothetical protein